MNLQTIIQKAKQDGGWLTNHRAAVQIQKLRESGQWQSRCPVRMAFLSSFTVQPLIDYLTIEAAAGDIDVIPYQGPYGQIVQEIANPSGPFCAFKPEIALIAAEYESLDSDPVQAAHRLIELARTVTRQTTSVAILCTFVASPAWPLHMLSTEKEARITEANALLRRIPENDPQIRMCDVDRLAAYHGYANACSPEMLSMARIPFSEPLLTLLAKQLTAQLAAAKGRTKKCLVLDCDNTLWGGIIGEDGMDGITLGPNWPGREFVEFQKAVLELYEQGVILALNSKNNEADVLQALREHPHSVLRENHFAAIAVNWNPKPENMKQLAGEINIGLDSLVFVDDNPAERQLMAQMLPEVAILDLPANPALYAKTLRETNFFAKASMTEEDKQRGQMYAAQRQRTQLEKKAVSLEDYLKSLDMECTIRQANESDIKRAAQLTQRTNQFNLTTRRYTEADIRQILEDPHWNVYVLGLNDKFGDNGIVGLALVQKQDQQWRIDTFLMSCRVIGRQAEDAFVDRICTEAADAGVKRLATGYIKTQKNALVADFWDKMNFSKTISDENVTQYAFNLENYQPKHFEYLKIK